MKFHYISPSILPSRTANSIHVVQQCEALAQIGLQVTLYAKRSTVREETLREQLRTLYGAHLAGGKVVSYYSGHSRADTLRIALMAWRKLRQAPAKEAVLSRNLYASYLFAALHKRPLIFETHQLEYGFRKRMQRAIMTKPWVTTVVISQKLEDCLTEHHQIAPARALVLHDAAPPGVQPVAAALRRAELIKHVEQAHGDWDAVCGYFGHLYTGRGIEIIQAMATARPRVLFLVFGGNEAEVEACRRDKQQHNLIFMGHISHTSAQRIMPCVDVLLMPYQASVSIGTAGHDTARWMSPMKMFEYLASGVPIISSDLEVLREVLLPEKNCLLAVAHDPASWVAALDQLLTDSALAARLGEQGHADYEAHYTWQQRAQKLHMAALEL